MQRRRDNRREEAHEGKGEKFKKLMEVLKKQNSDKNIEVSDKTEDE